MTGYSGKRVLIMEDDMILTLSLELMLKKAGVNQVLRAKTGEEAIDITLKERPDLLIADIYLGGGINGTEAVHRIQQNREIPVIYITGNSDLQNRKEADKTDYIDYLVKPITNEQLADTLSKVWGEPTDYHHSN